MRLGGEEKVETLKTKPEREETVWESLLSTVSLARRERRAASVAWHS